MALVIETFLICDDCGKSLRVDNRHFTGYEHRIKAKAEGWNYSGNKDKCPDCRPKNSHGEYHGGRDYRPPPKKNQIANNQK